MTTEKKLFEYTDQKLKAHIQNNETFNQELVILYEFYKQKIYSFLKEEDKEKVVEDLFSSIKSQIFNGYYIGLELLNNDHTNIQNEFLLLAEGELELECRNILLTSTGDNPIEIIATDSFNHLISELIQQYENVYTILVDIALNTATMGLKWSFLDERIKRGIKSIPNEKTGILAGVGDVTFINPQQYLTAFAVNNTTEEWELYNSGFTGNEKYGEIFIMQVYNLEFEQYVASFYFLNKMTIDEQQNMMDSLVLRLMSRLQIERHQLIINGSSVEEFYELQG